MAKLYKPCVDEKIDWEERIKLNWKQIDECDEEAKQKGELVGRYINEPYADGYAIYQIIKQNKKTVRIRVCTEIGDDWVIPFWGEETSIPVEYALQKVGGRDRWAEYVKNNKK